MNRLKQSKQIKVGACVDRCRIFWYERFCACFVLSFALQTPEGTGGEKGGSANFRTKHTEPFIPESTALV